ncbi:MAG: type II toxin-antitoxin system RelE/ParE family toxin [Chrysiogenetes bacterium]|nr:type II toxin-antitoxin system RelE/ParE family toxin [Chrysiogenetes bacterium]
MAYSIVFSEYAVQDLNDLHEFGTLQDSSVRADAVLDQIEKVCAGLAELPNRGRRVPELEEFGELRFREIRIKPWRIFYRVTGKRIYIHGILDGRRSLRAILAKRAYQPES